MSEWIKISEQIPELGADVLLYIKYGYFDIGRFLMIDGTVRVEAYGDDNAYNNADFATHWMPLPEPPKEVN